MPVGAATERRYIIMAQNTLESTAIQREAISSRIAMLLRKSIFTGEYRPGDRLPPERDIAERFGVSRVTVRQALQEIEREEWIEIVQGRGATVMDFNREIGIEVLSRLLASCPRAVVTPDTFMTMHDFSNWLYKQICVSAARRAGAGDRQKLLDIIHEYRGGISVEDYMRIEGGFYHELLRIGDNLILRMFFNTYMNAFEHLARTGVLSGPPLPRELFIAFHTGLADAVCENRTDRIEETIEKHKPAIQSALAEYLMKIGVEIRRTDAGSSPAPE